MGKYKVSWEERRYAIVEADSAKEAENLVKEGEFDKDFSEEITSEPKAIDIATENKGELSN